MQLSDVDIRKGLKTGDITIDDFDEKRLQPASYDVLLDKNFMIFDRHALEAIDPHNPVGDYMKKVEVTDEEKFFVLHPGEFALGVTVDRFGCNEKYACQLMGKSSLARLGLIIHTTAGFIDPGNVLNATLELYNTNSLPIKLYPGMKIGQIAFHELKTPASRPYGHKDFNSKYFGSSDVEASKMSDNY